MYTTRNTNTTYVAMRPSVVARRKREQRKQLVKDVIGIAVALPLMYITLVILTV